MARSKRGGKAHVSGYARYKTNNKEIVNRKTRLTKLIKENPNNLQLQSALTNVAHRRNKPKAPFWSHSMIRTASLIKSFTGKFTKSWFSTDPDTFAAARKVRDENKFSQLKIPKLTRSGFSIGERVEWTS